MLTVALAILKYGLMAVGAGLGIHGVLNDYKAKGKLTREGRRAIALMIVVGVLTVVAAGLEQYAAHRDHAQKLMQERLGRPLKDLTIRFAIAKPQADAFVDEMGRGGSRADPNGSLVYIGAAIQNGALEVTKTITGWQLGMSLSRPQGMVSQMFREGSPEWKAFERGIQRVIGTRFDLSLSDERTVLDLAGATWPMKLRITSSAISFEVVDPPLSPLDLKNFGIVFTHRGSFRPSEIHLLSSDPRVTLNQKWPVTWTARPWRSVPNAEGDPEALLEYVSAPIQVDPAALQSKPQRPSAKAGPLVDDPT